MSEKRIGLYKDRQDGKVNGCIYCGKPVKNKFCNHSCQMSHQNKLNIGKTYDEIYGAERARKKRKKMSKSIQKVALETGFTKKGAQVSGKGRKGLKWVDVYGEESYENIRCKVSSSLKKYFRTEKGLKQADRHSKFMVSQILSGKEFHVAKKGYYKGVKFASSLEKDFLQLWEKSYGDLLGVERNKIVISRVDNPKRWTIPDYAIVEEGKQVGIIEVKYEGFLNRPEVYRKVLSLQRYSERTGIPCGLFTWRLRGKFFARYANLEPRHSGSLLSACKLELLAQLVECKVQRLTDEREELNKSVNLKVGVGFKANDAAPCLGREYEIVRYPMKIGGKL